MAVEIVTKLNLAAENQKFLYVPVSKNEFARGLYDGHVSITGKDVLAGNGTVAKRRLARNAPDQTRIVVDTPLLMVFQVMQQYRTTGSEGELPIGQAVAVLYDKGHVVSTEALGIELAATLDGCLGVDIHDIGKRHITLSRMTFRPAQDYGTDISEKIARYNNIVSFWKSWDAGIKVVDGEVIPRRVSSMVENVTYQLGSDDFASKLKFARKNFPQQVPGKEETNRIREVEFKLSADSMAAMARSINGICATYGLTEEESALMNGLNLMDACFKKGLGLDSLIAMSTGKTLITPGKMYEARQLVSTEFPPF